MILHDSLSELLGEGLVYADKESMGRRCELIVVVGGDGSLLGTARELVKHQLPVIGVNRGKLGFLTDIKPDEIEEKVNAVLDGFYTRDERILLDVQIERNGAIVGTGTALNDVVLNSGGFARMIEFDLFINEQFVYTQHSDGLIISTPTGSTAYALSGGGPIMHPSLNTLVLVPMFPHSLTARPVVVSSSEEIRIVVGDCSPYISCDGQVRLDAAPGDVVRIVEKPHKLTLLQTSEHDFYEACRDKLGWSSRLTPSSEEREES